MTTETRLDIDLLKTLIDKLMDNGERLKLVEYKTDELKADVQILKADVSELKSEMQAVKTDMQVMKTDMQVMKTDMQVMKTDMQVMKTDMQALKADMQEIKPVVVWVRWIGGALITIALALAANTISSYF